MLFIASAVGYTAGPATTLDTSSTLNLAAGDVVIAFFGGNIGSVTFDSVAEDDASNSFTVLGATTSGYYLASAYLLSASASSTATIRATLSGDSNGEVELIVLQFRPESGETPSLGSGPGSNNSAWGSNPVSDPLSTESDDSLYVGAAINDRTALSSPLIGGSSPDGTVSGTIDFTAGYTVFDSAQTDNTFATTSGSGVWSAQLIVIDIDVAAAVTVDVTQAAVTIAAQNATVTVTTAVTVDVTQAAVTIAAKNPDVSVETAIDAGQAAVTIEAQNPDVSVETAIDATQSAVTIEAQAPTVSTGTVIDATQAAVTIEAQNADIDTGTVDVDATQAAVTIAAQNPDVSVGTVIDATQTAVTIEAKNPTVSVETAIAATGAAVTIAAHNLTVTFTVEVEATTGAVIITGANASISTATTAVTPAARTYTVPAETRVYTVPAETRVYTAKL